MKFRVTLILLFISLLNPSCRREQWDDCISSAGAEKTIVRELDDFSALEVYDQFEIELIQDTTGLPRITLSGGGNLLEGIQTEVKNGVLLLRNRNICNFVRRFNQKIVLRVYFSDLTRIEAFGNSRFISNDTLILGKLSVYQLAVNTFNLMINAQELEVQSLDAGTFNLQGRCDVLKGSVERVSTLDARQLDCRYVLIDSHTPLDLFIRASEVIFVKIFNKGNIYYTGQAPSQKLELNERKGTGDLLPLP